MLALLAGIGFLIALLSVIAAPIGDDRARPRMTIPPRQETSGLETEVERARVRAAGADAALIDARLAAIEARQPRVPIDTFPPALRARRDTLARRAAALSALIRRAEDAPLPASYRALAEDPSVRGDRATVALVDSLGALEQQRALYEASGIVDTAFIAITGRLAGIGDSLQGLATQKLAALRHELSSLQPRLPDAEPAAAVDTMPFRVALDSTVATLAAAERELARARAHNDSVTALEARARQAASRSASPPVIIASAGVVGIAFGFLVALLGEMRQPRISDPREAEVASRAPVLTHVTPDAPGAQRSRRRADQDVPPLIELSSDRYGRLYHRLADAVARLPRVAVIGDSAPVVATIAGNLAAAAAHTARLTLLLDADFETRSVASVMLLPGEPGMADVLARRVHWSAALRHQVVGRDRYVDVLPAGNIKSGSSLSSAADSFRLAVEHIATRYDTVVISAPASRQGVVRAVVAAVPDVVICARVSRTPVRLLQRLVSEVRNDGARVRGIVLWEREDPVLLAPAEPTRSRPAEEPVSQPA